MSRTVAYYRSDPVCALSAYTYKLSVAVGANSTRFRQMLSVLDTGAVHNVIRAECVPEEVLRTLDTTREVVNLSTASKVPLPTLRIVKFHVKVDNYT